MKLESKFTLSTGDGYAASIIIAIAIAIAIIL